MKRRTLAGALLTLLLFAAPLLAKPSSLPAYSQAYDPARDAMADAYAAQALAAQTARKVYIAIGGLWCSWCHQFDRMLEDAPQLAQAFAARFVVLKVNVSDENGNADFLAGLPPFQGYPHFFVAEPGGKVILSVSPAEFLHKGKFSAEKFSRFVTEVGAEDYQPL